MTDRADELVEEIAARYKAELRKCAAEARLSDPFPGHPFMKRAKLFFGEGVRSSGGATLVSNRVGCTEGNVRLQELHPKRSPTLEVIYALCPEAKKLIGRDLIASAEEDERALRHAG